MRKLAIIDLDRVVADSSERFKMALRPDGRTDWKIALNPDNVQLDVIVPGAVEALTELFRAGYEIMFLTGRPENMRHATERWLEAQHLDPDVFVMRMRPDGDFTKAAVFKLDQIAKIIAEVRPEEILFVDDLIDEYPDLLSHVEIVKGRYSSLAACIAGLDKTL